MPVSVAVMTVVIATVAIATRPKSLGVSRRPRIRVPSRYTTLLEPNWAPFHSTARPARFSSLPPAVAAALVSTPTCRHAPQQVNHERPAVHLAQQVTPERADAPALAAACQLIQQPDDERCVEPTDPAPEPAALGISVLRIHLGHVSRVTPVQMSYGDFRYEVDLVAFDERAVGPLRVFAIPQQLRFIEGAGIVEYRYRRAEITAREMIAFQRQRPEDAGDIRAVCRRRALLTGEDPPTDDGARILAQCQYDLLEPARSCDAVIVGGGKKFGCDLADARIASRGRATLVGVDVSDLHVQLTELAHHLVHAAGCALVGQDDFGRQHRAAGDSQYRVPQAGPAQSGYDYREVVGYGLIRHRRRAWFFSSSGPDISGGPAPEPGGR